jgi:transcriptional antiterminator NusG
MGLKWYALSLQAGREDKIKENLEKRIKSQGIENLFGQMVIPTERVQEIKEGKRRERERRIHGGYMYLQIETGETGDSDYRWVMAPEAYYIVKETPGIGNFIGEKNRPTVMTTEDVNKILRVEEEIGQGEEPTVKIDLNKGDQVKIKSGPFENFDGVVDEVLPAKGTVRVTVMIFGRAVGVEVEHWQVSPVGK